MSDVVYSSYSRVTSPPPEFPFVVSVLEGERIVSWWENISEHVFDMARQQGIDWVQCRDRVLLEHNCINGAGYDVYFRSREDYLFIMLKWS